jgi:hypothetical protein
LQVLAFHHSPEKAGESRKLVAVVALANDLLNALEQDGVLPDSAQMAAGGAARILGLGVRQIEALTAAAMEFYEQGQNFIAS